MVQGEAGLFSCSDLPLSELLPFLAGDRGRAARQGNRRMLERRRHCQVVLTHIRAPPQLWANSRRFKLADGKPPARCLLGVQGGLVQLTGLGMV